MTNEQASLGSPSVSLLPLSIQRTWLAYAACLASVLLFGTKGVFVKIGFDYGVSTNAMMFLRVGFALPFYLAMAAMYLRPPLPWRDIGLAASLGALGYWFSTYLNVAALSLVSVQLERLLMLSYPALVITGGYLFFGYRISRAGLIGVALSYAGVLLVLCEEFLTAPIYSYVELITGALLVACSAVSFSVYQLWSKPIVVTFGFARFTAVAMSTAGILSICQWVLLDGIAEMQFSRVTIILGAVLALGATVIPSLLLNYSLVTLSSQAVAIIWLVGPVFSIALAVIVLDERVTWLMALGTILVLIGAGTFTYEDRRRRCP